MRGLGIPTASLSALIFVRCATCRGSLEVYLAATLRSGALAGVLGREGKTNASMKAKLVLPSVMLLTLSLLHAS